MKTLIDCTPLSVGGGVQVALGLLAGLQRSNGSDWIAAVPTHMRDAMPPVLARDSRVRILERRSFLDRLRISRALAQMEAEFKANAVFTVFGPPMFRARAPHLVGFAQPHMIYDPEPGSAGAGLLGRAANLMRAALFRRADYIVVETETARRRFCERIGFDPERVHVIPNAPNPLLERPCGDAAPDAPFVILMPSAWYAHKNLEMAPRVARVMRDLAPELDFRFDLTLPRDGEGWRKVAALANELGVANRVGTLGARTITQLPEAYRDASVVYLPTVREVSTAVYPESFFFRRPLVTTDVDFARELCGDAAIFTPAGDASAAARHLLALARSDDLRQDLVARGQARLAAAYPTSERKFEMQIELLSKVAAWGRRAK